MEGEGSSREDKGGGGVGQHRVGKITRITMKRGGAGGLCNRLSSRDADL